MPEPDQNLILPDALPVEPRAPTPALNVLSVLRGGHVFDLLSLEFQRAVLALEAAGDPKAKAKVKIEVTLAKHPKKLNTLFVSTDIDSKLPPEDIDSDILFYDETTGELMTRNPNQREMFEGPQG
jgi:hypothetical protein